MTVYEKELTETLTLTDSFSYNWDTSREFTETLTLADSDIYDVITILTDTLTLSDGDVYGTSIELEETLTLTDTHSYNWDTSRSYTETLTLTDTHLESIGRELTETLTLSDGDILLSQVIRSTDGAWMSICSSRLSLAKSVQDFIDALEDEQIPINMMDYSCNVITGEASVLEFNLVAMIKKH